MEPAVAHRVEVAKNQPAPQAKSRPKRFRKSETFEREPDCGTESSSATYLEDLLQPIFGLARQPDLCTKAAETASR